MSINSRIFIKKSNFPCSLTSKTITSAPLRTTMRRLVPLILATLLVGASLVSAQTVATDPVGFITLTAKGTTGLPGNPSSALTFVGLAFTEPVAYQATFSSASGTTLTDSSATWADNAYNGATNNYY